MTDHRPLQPKNQAVPLGIFTLLRIIPPWRELNKGGFDKEEVSVTKQRHHHMRCHTLGKNTRNNEPPKASNRTSCSTMAHAVVIQCQLPLSTLPSHQAQFGPRHAVWDHQATVSGALWR